MAIVIIAKNNTASDLIIDDLGITVTALGQKELTEYYDYIEIIESDNLKILVSNSDITINDGINDLNISNALLHLEFESEYQDLLQDEGTGGGVEVDLLCIQNRRTTNFDLTTSWQTVQLDTTDINSDPTKMIFIPSDTLQVVESGYYKIVYNFQIETQSSTVYSYARFLVNGTTIISGSEMSVKTYPNEIHELHNICVAELNANDQITIQIMCESTPVVCYGVNFNCVKLNGVKGDSGPPGGTTVVIQKDDTDIVTNTAIINFEGSVNVVDEGSNKSTVTISTGSHEIKYFQAYDSIGNIDVHTSTPTPIPWDVEQIKDVDAFDHSIITNNSRVYVLHNGWYDISYNVSSNNSSNSRRNPRLHVRINGTTDIIQSVSYSYVRLTNERGTNIACFLTHLNAGDYIELIAQRNNDSGTVLSVSNESWITLKYIRSV